MTAYLSADPTVVTCDTCTATSGSGWGDQPTCLGCTPADLICDRHQRTFVGACPFCPQITDRYGVTFVGDDFSDLAETMLAALAKKGGTRSGWYVDITVMVDRAKDEMGVVSGILTSYGAAARLTAVLWPQGDDGDPDFNGKATLVYAPDVVHIAIA